MTSPNPKKPTSPLKRLHSGLTELTAEYPGIMWGTMVLDTIVIFVLILLGLDALGARWHIDSGAFRMVVFGYGIINAIFYTVSFLTNVCEPAECGYTTQERMERYGKVLAPMFVLFPILIPMWTGLIASILVAAVGYLLHSVYKRLESAILK